MRSSSCHGRQSRSASIQWPSRIKSAFLLCTRLLTIHAWTAFRVHQLRLVCLLLREGMMAQTMKEGTLTRPTQFITEECWQVSPPLVLMHPHQNLFYGEICRQFLPSSDHSSTPHILLGTLCARLGVSVANWISSANTDWQILLKECGQKQLSMAAYQIAFRWSLVFSVHLALTFPEYQSCPCTEAKAKRYAVMVSFFVFNWLWTCLIASDEHILSTDGNPNSSLSHSSHNFLRSVVIESCSISSSVTSFSLSWRSISQIISWHLFIVGPFLLT